MLLNPHSTIRPCESSSKLRSHHYIRWAENFPVRGPNVYTKSPSWPRPFQLLSARSSSLSGQVSPPHTPDSGVPIHRRQWAQKPNQYSASAQLSGLWKSKEITAQHCSSLSRWQTLWESQHSSPQHFACDAALVHSALSDWANYPGGPPARLGSARLCSAAVAHGGLTAAAAKESLSPGHKQEVNPPHRPCLHWLWSAY